MRNLLEIIIITSIGLYGCNFNMDNQSIKPVGNNSPVVSPIQTPMPSVVNSKSPSVSSSPSQTAQAVPAENSCVDNEYCKLDILAPSDYNLQYCNTEIYVYDENNNPVNNFKINMKCLSRYCNEKNEITLDSQLPYKLLNLKSGVSIRFRILKKGYTTRIRELVPACSVCEAVINVIFGDSPNIQYGHAKYFLSTRPETTPSMPTYNSKDVPLNTPIKLTFSEPIDKQTVEDNLIIKVADAGDSNLKSGDIIFTSVDYNITWNTDETEATFTPKDGKLLPASKIPPKYAIAFKTPFKDKDGNLANDKNGYFRIEPDNYMESYFTVVALK